MRYTSAASLRSPKKEEQEVPDTTISSSPNFNKAYYPDEEFNILDELEGVLNSEEEQKVHKTCTSSSTNHQLHWDFMEWEEFPSFGEEAEDEEEDKVTENNRSKCILEGQQVMKKEENRVGFWEVEDEKMVSLNLNLNYQEVLDAWSDRGSLWADDDCSLSFATNNSFYVSTNLHFH